MTFILHWPTGPNGHRWSLVLLMVSVRTISQNKLMTDYAVGLDGSLISLDLFYLSFSGELDIAFLYMKDTPLKVPFQTFSFWFGARYGLSSLALLIILPLLKKLNLSDAFVCMIGLISKMAGLIVLGLIRSKEMIFLGNLKCNLYSFWPTSPQPNWWSLFFHMLSIRSTGHNSYDGVWWITKLDRFVIYWSTRLRPSRWSLFFTHSVRTYVTKSKHDATSIRTWWVTPKSPDLYPFNACL